jgi:hypothetical protein
VAVAAGLQGRVCLTGQTNSPDFPVHRAVQPHYAGPKTQSVSDSGDAFIACLPSGRMSLIHRGGTSYPVAKAVALAALVVGGATVVFGRRRNARRMAGRTRMSGANQSI